MQYPKFPSGLIKYPSIYLSMYILHTIIHPHIPSLSLSLSLSHTHSHTLSHTHTHTHRHTHRHILMHYTCGVFGFLREGLQKGCRCMEVIKPNSQSKFMVRIQSHQSKEAETSATVPASKVSKFNLTSERLQMRARGEGSIESSSQPRTTACVHATLRGSFSGCGCCSAFHVVVMCAEFETNETP